MRALIAGLLFFISSNLFAYSFTSDFQQGFYWESFPIGFNKFVTDASDGPLLSQLVGESESQWENAVGRDIWGISPGYIVTSGGSGNYVRWSSNFGGETGYDPTQTLAITIRYNSGTHVIRTEIILNGSFPGLKSNFNGLLKKTVLHEMGHTIGLDHSAEYSIMSATVGGVEALTFDDQNGATDVINTTLWRQSVGYISEFSSSEGSDESSAACGTVDMGGGDGSGGNGFFVSFLIGLVFIAGSKKRLFSQI